MSLKGVFKDSEPENHNQGKIPWAGTRSHLSKRNPKRGSKYINKKIRKGFIREKSIKKGKFPDLKKDTKLTNARHNLNKRNSDPEMCDP